MVSAPEKMGHWAMAFGFIAFTIPFELARYKSMSFPVSISIGLTAGILYYIGVLVYVYNKVFFKLRF